MNFTPKEEIILMGGNYLAEPLKVAKRNAVSYDEELEIIEILRQYTGKTREQQMPLERQTALILLDRTYPGITEEDLGEQFPLPLILELSTFLMAERNGHKEPDAFAEPGKPQTGTTTPPDSSPSTPKSTGDLEAASPPKKGSTKKTSASSSSAT